MIHTIELKFGAAPGQARIKLEVAPVTVFVGPNNAGKSKVLQEMHKLGTCGRPSQNDVILDRITFLELPPTQIPEITENLSQRPRQNEHLRPGHVIVGNHRQRHQVQDSDFRACLRNPNRRKTDFCRLCLSFYMLMLDGKSRIALVKERDATDLQQPPQNVLDILFRDEEKRERVRSIAHDAFGDFFVIDPTKPGKFRIRYSQIPPKSSFMEQSLCSDAVRFHGDALDIDEMSDGVKAFTGIISQIIAGDPSVILIDEPEAFLHPALAFKLGKEIAVSASSTNKRVFVSTHSANFVMGCIQSGVPTNIIRLTYQRGVATARTLLQDELLRLMRHPLLRSTGVIEGLFYESVVVTESDADRAFYQEVNERLVRSGRGIQNCLFLNAQNWQTIQQIIRPLRKHGIPAACIVDVDVIKVGGKPWRDFLRSGFVPEVSLSGFGQTRSEISKKFADTGRDMKRDGGIEVLCDTDREAANNLFDQLADYGLFVVKRGELETWLPELEAGGHGSPWLIEMFDRMGEDPEHPGYVTPGTGDVWAFLDEIANWLRNPGRKGIPP